MLESKPALLSLASSIKQVGIQRPTKTFWSIAADALHDAAKWELIKSWKDERIRLQ